MTVAYHEILRKTVAIKNLKTDFQVISFSRYRMDLFSGSFVLLSEE